MNKQTGFKFLAFPNYQRDGDKWMTEDQEKLNIVYGWTSLCIAASACLFIVLRLLQYIRSRYNFLYEVSIVSFCFILCRESLIIFFDFHTLLVKTKGLPLVMLPLSGLIFFKLKVITFHIYCWLSSL